MDTIGGDFDDATISGAKRWKSTLSASMRLRNGLLDVLFVNCFVIQEPFAIIIALQVPEELETFFWEC